MSPLCIFLSSYIPLQFQLHPPLCLFYIFILPTTSPSLPPFPFNRLQNSNSPQNHPNHTTRRISLIRTRTRRRGTRARSRARLGARSSSRRRSGLARDGHGSTRSPISWERHAGGRRNDRAGASVGSGGRGRGCDGDTRARRFGGG